jgi:hypothetical protein
LSSEYYQLSSEPPPTTQIESFFDVFAPVGLTALAIPGPVSYADSFFEVFFDVQFSDGGIMSHHLHGQIPTGQDLALTNVSGVMVAARPDRQIVRYEWSFHGRPDALLPVMIVELTGSYVPEPATLVLMLLGVIGTAALWDVGHWCKSQRRRRVGHGGTRHLPWRTPNIRIK